MNKMIKSNKFSKLLKDKKGATMVEYAILLFLILVRYYALSNHLHV